MTLSADLLHFYNVANSTIYYLANSYSSFKRTVFFSKTALKNPKKSILLKIVDKIEKISNY